ncbi:MAG: hypothetical protein EBQ57_02505 [Actinobacteria bacterium]|nr:hypothetical protein [Actinomycetota bacterium]
MLDEPAFKRLREDVDLFFQRQTERLGNFLLRFGDELQRERPSHQTNFGCRQLEVRGLRRERLVESPCRDHGEPLTMARCPRLIDHLRPRGGFGRQNAWVVNAVDTYLAF